MNNSKSAHAIVERFIFQCLKKFKYRKIVQQNNAAALIQKQFRMHLLRLIWKGYYENTKALKIQRRYRRFRADISENSPRRIMFEYSLNKMRTQKRKGKSEKPPKKKIIIELPPPWKNKKKLSPRQIEDALSDQMSDVKWINQMVMPQFTRYTFGVLEKRDRLRQKDQMFKNRQIPRTFFTFVTRSFDKVSPIVRILLHPPTFHLYIIHKKGIQVMSINPDQDTFVFYPLEYHEHISDVAIDSRSGRLFILLSNWTITVFENGFFTKPRKLSVQKPVIPQKRYMYCDKFGELWIVLTQGKKSAYLLDSLCFSMLKEIRFNLPKDHPVKQIVPLFNKAKLIGFIATSHYGSELFVCNERGKSTNNFAFHRKFTPEFLVTKNHVFTYGFDNKVVIFKRNLDHLVHLKTLEFQAKPLSISFIKDFSLLVVSLSDCTLNFYTTSNEAYSLNIPFAGLPDELAIYAEDVLGKPQSTKSFNMFNRVCFARIQGQATEIITLQYAQNCVFIFCKLDDSEIAIYYLFRKHMKVACACYDVLKYPPTYSSPFQNALRMTRIEHEIIYPSVKRTRKQLERDSLYLQQIGREFEKRFISGFFMKYDSEKAGQILMQSPYRRWCRFLSFCGQDLSLYEFFNLTNLFDITVPSISTPEKLNSFILSSHPSNSIAAVGPFQTTIATKFDIKELSQILDVIKAVFGAQLSEFTSFKAAVLSLDLSVQSIMMKAVVREFNAKAIHRITEIENFVKNKLRNQVIGCGIEELNSKKSKNKPEYPEIIPETVTSILTPRLIKNSLYVMPDPLFETFRYKPTRELNLRQHDIRYCKYGNDYESAKIVPNDHTFALDELSFTRPLAKHKLCVDIAAISPDGEQIVFENPLSYIPLSYILQKNQIKQGKATPIGVARYWLSQLLMIIAAIHEHSVVVRSLLPSNILISNDGSHLMLQTLADACFDGETETPLPYENVHSTWLPPEHWAGKPPTPAFDIFQFGVLMLLILTDYMPPSFGEVIAEHKKYSSKDPMIIAKSRRFFFDPFSEFKFEDFPFMTAKNDELRVLAEVDSKSSFFDIITSCLDIDPSRRPTAAQLLALPFFNIQSQMLNRARGFAYTMIRHVPLSIFVDSVFGTLCNFIDGEFEMQTTNIPTLETAVDILNYFINLWGSGVNISFPIEDSSVPNIVEEIFTQNIFDRIVDYVIKRLRMRFESETNIREDIPFNKLVALFTQFIKSGSTPERFAKIFSSFKYLATGIRGQSDSHRLFCFMHHNVRSLVEYFFTQMPNISRSKLQVSEFYCEHFLQFYDNSRDFAEAFAEQSERRHASSLSFFSTFIDMYPTPDTMKLLIDFRVQHQIEQSLYFSFSTVRFAALELISKILNLECFDPVFFDGFVFHQFPHLLVSDTQPYNEKVLLLSIVHDFFFSRAISCIVSLMTCGILDAILFCSSMHPDRQGYLVWGSNIERPIYKITKELLAETIEKGLTNVIAVIFSSNEFVLMLVRMGVINEPDSKAYYSMIERLKNFDVDQSLITTLKIAENSSLSTITSITRQSHQSFEASLWEIAKFLTTVGEQRYLFSSLFHSVINIWENQGWQIYEPLFEAVIDGMKHGVEDHVQMVLDAISILHRTKLIDCFTEVPKIWVDLIQRDFAEVKKIATTREGDYETLDLYSFKRWQRLAFLKAIICHPNNVMLTELTVHTPFVDFLVNNLLADASKFDITMKIVPNSFVKYNHTYPMRSEATNFIRAILRNRIHCESMFFIISQQLKTSDILAREARLVKKKKERDFRRTSVRILNLLSTKNDAFKINEMIVKSEILAILKEEALNDWENYQMLRNTWDLDSMRARNQVINKIKYLYESL